MEDLKTFRHETHAWLEQNCPLSQRKPPRRDEQVWAGRNRTFPSDDARIWFERMRDKGWTVPEWPKEYGGGGLTPQQAQILNEEMQRLSCRTPLFDIGIWMLGPALLEFGTEEQKREHIPKIARGDVRWCQGYSEPSAGSDLASLQCKAEDKGDHFLVNGTKIWTTSADQSDWIFCLVRTDPNVKKQEGISFLLLDMDDPGVSVSPIQLISGESEFCQTFFDNVKVPKGNLVGGLNKGWSVAKGLLKHERKLMSQAGDNIPGSRINPHRLALKFLPKDATGAITDSELRRQLVDHEMQMRALGLTHFRMYEENVAGTGSTNTVLIMKYCGTEMEKNRTELLINILGSQGLGWEGESFSEEQLQATRAWLFSKALSIAGGCSEVQLNIIAKRALELPE